MVLELERSSVRELAGTISRKKTFAMVEGFGNETKIILGVGHVPTHVWLSTDV